LLELAWYGHFTVAVMLQFSNVALKIYRFVVFRDIKKAREKNYGIHIKEVVKHEVDEDAIPSSKKNEELFKKAQVSPMLTRGKT